MLLFSLPPWNVTISFRVEEWSAIISPLRLSHPEQSGGGSPPSDSSEFHILNFMDPNCWGHSVVWEGARGVRCSHPPQSLGVTMATRTIWALCVLTNLRKFLREWAQSCSFSSALVLSPPLSRFITRLSLLSLLLLKLISFPFFPYSGPKRWMFDISFEAC